MAADDIYRVKVNYEAPSGQAAWTIYYREDVAHDGPNTGPKALAEAFQSAMFPLPLTQALASEWSVTSIVTRMIYAELGADFMEPVWEIDAGPAPGTQPDDALPANNAIQYGLQQSTFPARSNGRIFVPGIPEDGTDVGLLTSAYAIAASVLRDALVQTVAELSGGAGRWTPGVISQKVLNAVPPIKDWSGAFAPVTGVVLNTIVATQRRRGTKVIGQS
jgi:hypothetical protein